MPALAVVHRTFAVLEAVAISGSTTAKQVANRLEIPLPSVYRLLNELVECGYLVRLKEQRCYELGPKCFDLGLSFQQRVAAPTLIRQATDDLHRSVQAASYFAVYRGSDIVLNYLSDCEKHPRLRPLRFGFHEAAHATAFGKILLAGMSPSQRDTYLKARGIPTLTSSTITDRSRLDEHLAEVSVRGVAWEVEEFLARQTCAAAPVHNGSGVSIGAVAVSMPTRLTTGRQQEIETALREYAGRCSQYMRAGA